MNDAKATGEAIVACDSRLSLLFLAAVSKYCSVTPSIYALEHDPRWAADLKDSLSAWGFESIALTHRPLVNYGPFDWYAVEPGDIPDTFGLLLGDGRPGRIRGGHRGLIVALLNGAKRGSLILISDPWAKRVDATIESWRAELDLSVDAFGVQSRYRRVKVERTTERAQAALDQYKPRKPVASEAERRRRFLRAYQEFMELADPTAIPGRLFGDLFENWGSTAASSREYITAILRETAHTDGPILECGSGLSTLLLAGIATKQNRSLTSLEHHRDWYRKVKSYLELLGLDTGRLHHAPLKRFDGFDWYSVPLGSLPDNIQLVVCDGPPGSTRGGRYGLVRVFGKLASNCVVLLDDFSRPGEKAVVDKWAKRLPLNVSEHGVERAYARITLVPAATDHRLNETV
jgi:predicted O-methyltransferase YrrM